MRKLIYVYNLIVIVIVTVAPGFYKYVNVRYKRKNAFLKFIQVGFLRVPTSGL